MLKHMLLAVSILFIAVAGTSCAPYHEVRTEDASAGEVAGLYSLILYGGTYGRDLETVAILSKEDAPYTIVPYAPEFEYRIIKHVPAKEALSRANAFVSLHPDFYQTQLTRIVDSKTGALLGYEVRPLYRIQAYGYYDVLYIDYWKKNGKVFVKMHIIYQVEKNVYGGGGSHTHGLP
ncbi:MAG: hypothetical protein HQL09_05580 [Nitrospirae bacterium]|nr:hypothetical protein [Nitrospirota bacterium]